MRVPSTWLKGIACAVIVIASSTALNTLIQAAGPLNITGSSWDPIIITGAYEIKAGHPGGGSTRCPISYCL